MLRSSEKSRPPTIERTLEISGFDACVRVRHGQVLIEREGEVVGRVPAAEIGVLVVDTPLATFTSSGLVEIVERGGVVLLCGADHMPSVVLLPTYGNQQMVERKTRQLALSRPKCKRLWQQLVRAKIHNQAQAALDPEVRQSLLALVARVASGDPTNVEARAARLYWQHWLGDRTFVRDRKGPPPNNFLNYGYMVLRGLVARTLCAAGLDPTLGLHHKGPLAGFPLADDFMEPLRPWVDRAALELHLAGAKELNREAKRRLLGVLYEPAWFGEDRSTVAVAAQRMIASFVAVLEQTKPALTIPLMPNADEVWHHAEKGGTSQEETGTETTLE